VSRGNLAARRRSLWQIVALMRIAIFDLDGTITRRDTLVPFLLGWLKQQGVGAVRVAGALPALLAYVFHRDRGKLKQSLVRIAMRGAPRAEVDRWAAEFARETTRIRLHDSAVRAIAKHKAAGDRLILMSASVDLYVPRIGEALGFHETICTGVRWNGATLDGHLTTENCRGEEKARQLRAIQSRFPSCAISAYGNALSDVPHLKLAEHGVFVNAPPRVQSWLKKTGIHCESWR
jgi:phosphatidylglycerophosphatase C